MIDNINAWLPLTTRAEADAIAESLPDARPVPNNKGVVVMKGHLENLSVSIYPTRLYIQGSLAKYLYASNLFELDADGMKDVVMKVSNALQFDVSSLRISKLEIGKIFVVPRPSIEYISRFWQFPRLRRIYLDPNSVYFQTKRKQSKRGRLGEPTRQIKAYDKRAEAMEFGWEIPDKYKDAPYLLKIEETIWDVARQLKLGSGTVLTLQNLCEPMYWDLLVKRLYETYCSIVKLHTPTVERPVEKLAAGDLCNALFASMLKDVGKERIDSFLAPYFQHPNIQKRDVPSRCKRKIKKTMGFLSEEDDIIAELDEVVKKTLFPSKP